MTATENLTHALVRLAADGGRPPCGEYGGHELWFSNDAADRALAADRCLDCQVFAACGAAADEQDERWGIWAGVDRTAGSKPSSKGAER